MITTKKGQGFFYRIMLVDGDADAQILFTESITDLNCRLQVFEIRRGSVVQKNKRNDFLAMIL